MRICAIVPAMKSLFAAPALVALSALSLAACSSEPAPGEAEANASAGLDASSAAAPDTASQAPVSDNAVVSRMTPPVLGEPRLGLQGLGDLRVGKPVPPGSSWAERGAQVSETCRTVSSPDFPGVYAIVERGEVRRISVGQRSDVKLAEGIGVGASEADVNASFPGFRAEPHAYQEAPAKYLTAPGAERGDPALRFEIGRDGKVSLIHVGTMPVLGYVEGCS